MANCGTHHALTQPEGYLRWTETGPFWNNTVIAESNDTIVVEGNHYFPESAIIKAHFKPSTYTTFCGWKGTASYFSVEVVGDSEASHLTDGMKPEDLVC